MNSIYRLTFFLLVLSVLVQLNLDIINPVDFTFVILLILNSIFLFSYSRHPISIYRNVQLFFSFFLILAPFIQFKGSIVFWGSKSFSQHDYLICNIILILVILLYSISYYFLKNRFYFLKFRKNNVNFNKYLFKYSRNKLILLYLISLSCFYITLSNNNFSLLSLLFRGGEFSDMSSDISGPLWLFSQFFIRPLPIIIFLSYYLVNNKFNIHFVIFGMIGIVTAFPLGMARFSVAALYIPLFIVFFPFLKRKFNFTIVFIFGFLFLFPFLDRFRRFTSETNVKFGLDFDMFEEGHFDTYQSLLSVLKYDIVTYGNQLLGVFLFWIPRSLWPAKPIGSGAYSAGLTNLEFHNISMNYFGEGYINFGYLGIFLFTFFLAYFSAYLDVKFIKLSLNNYLFPLWYYIVVGFIFFILRGDLLSSFAYFIGFSVGFLLIYKILNY
ncbi:O-antigen polymerase [Cyclobacterium roseum]|uniref:O-antigen polymerase n=1 Tax=Cyclobacterium roseum TaxID=2666137 RepID=UPI001391F44F|nr:O-antigen polymerase [Cyclobacterium roseum]